MNKVERKAVVCEVMPNIFLKKILSYPYEKIGDAQVFHLEDALDIEQVCACEQVRVCGSVDMLKENLESNKKANLYVSKNLVNRVLLEELLKASSQGVNIFWGIE